MLESSTPADGATNVSRTASFTGLFTLALAPASINSSTVRLLAPHDNVVPTSADVSGNALVVAALAGGLPGGTTYRVELAPSILDIAGRTLNAPYSRTFTTQAQQWALGAPEVAPLPNFTSDTAPTTAVDAAGTVHTAWVAHDGANDRLFAKSLGPAGGLWSSLNTIRSTDSGNIASYRLAAGPADAFLLWTEYPTGSSAMTVQLARYSASTFTWQPPVTVNAVTSGFNIAGAVPVPDAAGNLYVLASTLEELFVTRRDAATGLWTAPARIDKPVAGNYIFELHAVADSLGNLTAGWVQVEGMGRGIFAARYSRASAAWSSPQLVMMSPYTGMFASFDLAVDAAGVVSMVWARDNGLVANPTIEASRFDPTTNSWAPAVRLDTPGSALGATRPLVAVDGAGYATAVWEQSEGLYAARCSPGCSSWTTAQKISSGTNATTPAIAADIAGNVVVPFVQDNVMHAAHFQVSDGQWRAPVNIGQPSLGSAVFANVPRLAMDRAGTLTALWFLQSSVGGVPRYDLVAKQWR